MSGIKLPTFRGTKPTVENRCAKCGTDTTAGCWRRGWSVETESVNLCNRCGLQYKNGKLQSPIQDVSLDRANEPTRPQTVGGLRPSRSDVDESSSPYVAYSSERLADGPVAKKMLFYVHDAEGREKLALVGHDPRGTGHFTYESVEGFEPWIKCKNRKDVYAWLEDMGASHGLERSPELREDPLQCSEKPPVRPVLDREYCDYAIESVKEGEMESENFYLIDGTGAKRLALCGGNQGDWYRSVLKDHDVTFDDRTEAVGWIEWVVGKRDWPRGRSSVKEGNRSTRARDAYSSSLSESGQTKRRMSMSTIDELQVVFEDQDLMRWVLRKPTREEIELFHQWRKKLTVDSAPSEEVPSSKDDSSELLALLNLIQGRQTCLKLLEVSSLGRPISALQRHPNKEVAEVATEITKRWNEWTTRALEKLSAAKKRNALKS